MPDQEVKRVAAGQIDSPVSATVEQEILRAVARIGYGSVEVVIHDGKVVQIECREKIRVARNDAGRKTAIRQVR